MPRGPSGASDRANEVGPTGSAGYSPELNPVELLNHDVKADAAGRRRARSVVELAGELRAYARARQRHPEVVVRFFQHPDTSYAATQIDHTVC
jgi:hypothetical protein